MRVLLLHNPSAGFHGEEDLDRVKQEIRDCGHELVDWRAGEEGWTRELDRVDLLAVAGGDGTVGRVAKALAGGGPPLAILPFGTANNISCSLGLQGVAPEALVRGWEGARRMPLDLGAAAGPWGRRRFVESFGCGLFAWTLPEADVDRTLDHLGRRDAKVAYAQQMLKERTLSCPAFFVRASLDGDDVSGEYLLFEAMLTRYIGPNLFLAPGADPSDGLLDLVLLPKADAPAFRRDVEGWQNGERQAPSLPTYRGRRLTLEWSDFTVHLDDELWPSGPEKPRPGGAIDLSIERAAIEVLLPTSPSSSAGRRG